MHELRTSKNDEYRMVVSALICLPMTLMRCLVCLAVFGGDGQFETSALIDAMEECKKNNVDVINMSFGGPLPTKSEEEEFRNIHKKGILMIAAG